MEVSMMYIVVYMEYCRDEGRRNLVRKNHPFRNKGGEQSEEERED
jgi:hypothetical protein